MPKRKDVWNENLEFLMSSAVCLLSADCLLGQILFCAAGHLENFPSCFPLCVVSGCTQKGASSFTFVLVIELISIRTCFARQTNEWMTAVLFPFFAFVADCDAIMILRGFAAGKKGYMNFKGDCIEASPNLNQV